MIGKQKLPLFATIFPSFSEFPVTPFSGLPIPLLYDASTFKTNIQLVYKVQDKCVCTCIVLDIHIVYYSSLFCVKGLRKDFIINIVKVLFTF